MTTGATHAAKLTLEKVFHNESVIIAEMLLDGLEIEVKEEIIKTRNTANYRSNVSNTTAAIAFIKKVQDKLNDKSQIAFLKNHTVLGTFIGYMQEHLIEKYNLAKNNTVDEINKKTVEVLKSLIADVHKKLNSRLGMLQSN